MVKCHLIFLASSPPGSDGIGYVTTLQLAIHGARVYILSRSAQKAADAIAAMKASTPDKELDVRFLQIDLQSLGSVDEATKKFKATESRLHILVANAGVSFFIVSKVSKIICRLIVANTYISLFAC